MFDLRVPESMASLPGRVYVFEVEDKLPKRTHAERLAQMREYSRKRKQARFSQGGALSDGRNICAGTGITSA